MKQSVTLKLLHTTRSISTEDYTEHSLEKLNEIIESKTPVMFQPISGSAEYGFVETILGPICRVKFAYNILGSMYCEDPWENCRSVTVPAKSIRFLKANEL